MTGVTDQGFDRETFASLFELVASELRGKIDSRLTLSEKTVLGNVTNIFCDKLAKIWEVAETCYYGTDPAVATGEQLVALAELTGTQRRLPTRGTVTATLTLDANKDFAAGLLVAHAAGDADNRWRNRDRVITTSAGDYSVIFESEATGSLAYVGAGQLTEIATAVNGWDAITNANAAQAGQDLETIEELRIRRQNELQQAGSASLGAIEAAVGNVSGVSEAVGEENLSDVHRPGLPPRSFRITLWDGAVPQASDTAIAQAIYDNRPAGIPSKGLSSALATAKNGQQIREYFSRAQGVPITISAQIVASPSVSATSVKSAILAHFNAGRGIGDGVIYANLIGAAFDVSGVTNVRNFLINGVAGDFSIGSNQRATLVAGSITLTGNVT